MAVTMLTLAVLFAGATPATAQTFTPLYSFDAWGQAFPDSPLVQGRDGSIYGETNDDETSIYLMTPSGGYSVLWFASLQTGDSGGDVCYSGMTVGPDGLLYGTCEIWEENNNASGIIFKYDPSQGQNGFTILYTWPPIGDDRSEYPSPLTLGTDGNFYGTTNSDPTYPYGSVFKVTPSGTYTTLHAFQGANGNDGAYPSEETLFPGVVGTVPLALGKDGNFYGTTSEGGIAGQNNNGTVYKITPKGKIKIFYYFGSNTSAYGQYPQGVTQGDDGNFYGQAFNGGANDQGTIFKLTAGGKLTTLHSFNAAVDDAYCPKFALGLGPDGNFYQATSDWCGGGFLGYDSLYEITPKGKYTDLFNGFADPETCTTDANGCIPSSPLLLHTNGTFYGTTFEGGVNERGIFYSFSTGLQPFVSLQWPLGSVGETLGIFGQGFSSASGVSFNGAAASYNVESDTYMTATVPAGATTGYVTVSEGAGSLRSNIKFTVK